MSELFLHHSALSPPSHKVRLVLEDRGLAWDGRMLDLAAKQNLDPEYLAINPHGLVPTLVVDGRAVIESTIICELLEDLYPDEPRRPTDPFERARMRVWTKWADEVLHWAGSPILFGALARPRWDSMSEAQREQMIAATPDPSRAAKQRRLFEQGLDAPEVEDGLGAWARTLPLLEAELAQPQPQPWLLGDAISLADLSVAAYVNVLDYMQVGWVFEAFPRVREWFARIKARPSFARSIEPFVSEPQWAFIRAIAAKVGPGLGERIAARSVDGVR